MTMKELSNKKYAIVQLNIDASRLGYFDQHQYILENADFYTFPARDQMTNEEYVEYVATVEDLTKHYEFVLVCTRQCIMKFVEDAFHTEVVSSRAALGDVRYGLKDTVIINNPYYERYVAQPNGINGPTYIAENGNVTVIMPTFPEDEED